MLADTLLASKVPLQESDSKTCKGQSETETKDQFNDNKHEGQSDVKRHCITKHDVCVKQKVDEELLDQQSQILMVKMPADEGHQFPADDPTGAALN